MTPRLIASGLAFPGRLAATDLTLEAGTLTCLIGPNGSGKTSLLHALAGIGRPEGSVRIDGKDRDVLAPAARVQTLSFMPASRTLCWPVPARDIIALGGGKPETVASLIEALDLGRLADRRVDRLSTGERSRILLARALAARPALLLLDEPAANLDPLWRLRLMDLLRAEAQEGCAILMAVHDLDTPRLYADRLLVMAQGRLQADGPPNMVLDGPIIPEIFGVRHEDGGWRPA